MSDKTNVEKLDDIIDGYYYGSAYHTDLVKVLEMHDSMSDKCPTCGTVLEAPRVPLTPQELKELVKGEYVIDSRGLYYWCVSSPGEIHHPMLHDKMGGLYLDCNKFDMKVFRDRRGR